jgi:small subunit ribosomal protein S9
MTKEADKKTEVKEEKVSKKTTKTSTTPKGKYFEATGRRKTSVARVRLYSTKGEITVNDKNYKDYFQTTELQKLVEDSLVEVGLFEKMSATIRIVGGGIHSQAEAVRHGIARALVLSNEELKDVLKTSGHLTRDSRMRERKKPGLKRARKASQWSKR